MKFLKNRKILLWWSGSKKNGEFDIVTQDDKGYIFYEAKFRKEPVTEQMIREEICQVEQTGLECYKYGFFQGQDLHVKEQTTVNW